LNEASAQAIELERLEQEITLTLQDIDKSFAQSHKIINDKLIPIVKKYHASSKRVWTGVNFWKTLLETSANVELRGYEEAVENGAELESESHDEIIDIDHTEDESMRDSNEQMSPVKVDTAGTNHDILQESTNHTHKQFQKRYTDNFNNSSMDNDESSSPEKLKENPIMPQEKKVTVGFDTTDSILPPVPTANISNTNGTDVNQTTPTLMRSNTESESKHYVMHNNFDTTYKLQVSPRKNSSRPEPAVNAMTPRRHASKKRKSMIAQRFDSSPFDIETPKLRSDVHFSPVKGRHESPLRKTRQSHPAENEETTQRFPLTPRYGAGGNLLRTPGQVQQVANRYSQNFETSIQRATTAAMDDSEEVPNISPPVTLKFATVATTNGLRQTPARQAAQNIVKDILNNVSGINDTTQEPSFHDALSQVAEDQTKRNELEDFDEYLDKPRGSVQKHEWSDDDM
jgi:hypothetical protein